MSGSLAKEKRAFSLCEKRTGSRVLLEGTLQQLACAFDGAAVHFRDILGLCETKPALHKSRADSVLRSSPYLGFAFLKRKGEGDLVAVCQTRVALGLDVVAVHENVLTSALAVQDSESEALAANARTQQRNIA